MQELSKQLKKVCDDNNLDFNVLNHKYLPNKALALITQEHPVKKSSPQIDEELLDKIIIDDNEYYYEDKEDGKVYNNKTAIVGVYKDNKVLFND